MHKIFVSDGLVLSKRGVGESNILVAILTRELGLVRASARSARKEVSKLRFGLEPLTTARFSLVRGRNEWKLIGVESASRSALANSAQRRGQEGRIARLVLRLIHGEEPVPELYDTIIEGLDSLVQVGLAQESTEVRLPLDADLSRQSEATAEALECVLVLRIVDQLGYAALSPDLAPFLEGPLSSPDLIKKATHSRLALIRTINESLSATGL